MDTATAAAPRQGFELLDVFTVGNEQRSRIELLHGDLTAIPPEHAVDLLVISAFPNSYAPFPGTLVDAFFNKGLPLGELANHKAVDMRNMLGCWLSRPLSEERKKKFNIEQLLCFEPRTQTDKPWEVVGNIFRCINNFAFDEKMNRVAMPILASGNQNAPAEHMLPALLDAAAFWLKNGLPLDVIKFVVYREEHKAQAKELFDLWRMGQPGQGHAGAIIQAQPDKNKPNVAEKSNTGYDFFISYSHKQSKAVDAFVQALKTQNNSLRIFYDSSSIAPGATWLKDISDAIQHTKKFVAILSPDYRNSQVCWDEFQCAYYMETKKKQQIIQTVYFMNDDEMPPIMAIRSYIDCTEANEQALVKSAEVLMRHPGS
jgi:hypothetical protein